VDAWRAIKKGAAGLIQQTYLALKLDQRNCSPCKEVKQIAMLVMGAHGHTGIKI